MADMDKDKTTGVIFEVLDERIRQHAKWGEQNHPDGTGDPGSIEDANMARRLCDVAHAAGLGTWRHILDEELLEAYAEGAAPALRKELVQVAAVAVAWIEAIDRRMN